MSHPVARHGAIMGMHAPGDLADRERLVAMAVLNDQADPFNLDALAVSDRFRLFGFTRRDDYVAYLWVLRAMDRLRGARVAQAHTDDVAEVLAELAAAHNSVPRNRPQPFTCSWAWRSEAGLRSGTTGTSTGQASRLRPMFCTAMRDGRGGWMPATTWRQPARAEQESSWWAGRWTRRGTQDCARRCTQLAGLFMRRPWRVSFWLTSGSME